MFPSNFAEMKKNTAQTKRSRIHDYVPHAGNLAEKASQAKYIVTT